MAVVQRNPYIAHRAKGRPGSIILGYAPKGVVLTACQMAFYDGNVKHMINLLCGDVLRAMTRCWVTYVSTVEGDSGSIMVTSSARAWRSVGNCRSLWRVRKEAEE